MKNFLENYFQLSKHNTTIKKEMMAGVITFLTMSYILVVNPNILADAGMDKQAVFMATALATVCATLLMGFMAKLPIAQAPGMGLNSFFAYTVVLTMGYSWEFALTGVFLAGLIFLVLTLFNIRELIVNNIPKVLKEAIPVGIGLFITLIGLKSAGIVVSNPNTLVMLGDFSQHSVWIALAGLLVTGILLIKNINGSILIGIVVATVLGFVLGDVHLPTSIITAPPSMEPTFGKVISYIISPASASSVFSIDMLVVVFTFLFVNLFDTIGTLIGVVSKTGIADKNGNFPQMKKALLTDAIGTTFGAIAGTSSVTSYVESASGVAAGGRTGLTAVSVACMFALSIFLAPLFLVIPAAATAPALIVVGLFMISSVVNIDFTDFSEAIPAFITIVFMPFTYSIAEGIVFGMLSFTLFKVGTQKHKDVSPTLYVLSLLFLIKIVLDTL